ncbi:histidine--tRNA ligase, partial [bacterium]|nr:histidine--tRNA ligase [bacterium]
QGTVCGGGRYNNLVEEIGGKSVPAVGFGMGLERLIMVMEAANLYLGEEVAPMIYIAPLGEEQYTKAVAIVNDLRKNNVSAITDLMGKSLKAQMKYADKIGVKYVVVVGENEIAEDKAVLKNMLDKENTEIKLSEVTKYFL